jgi:hypothetical protein
VNKLPATILAAPFWIVSATVGAIAFILGAVSVIFLIVAHLIQESGNDKVKK